MKVSPHPTTLPLGSSSRSAKAARASATCLAVIWSALARRSGVTGYPRPRSRTNSRQRTSWSPRNPSASCLASSSSSVSCISLLLVSSVPEGLLAWTTKLPFIIQAAKLRLEHRAYIRRAGGIGVDRLLEIARPQARADREGEEVDDLLGVQTQQVRPQNALGALLDECLEPRMRERYPPRGIPACGVLVVRREVQTLGASRFLKEAYPYERRGRKDHAGNATIVRSMPVALQKVPGHDIPLHPCHRRERKPAAGYRVARCVHGLVAHALQILVHRDAFLPICHPPHLQVELVDLRRTPGGMHHQVGFDCVLLRSRASVDKHVVALP